MSEESLYDQARHRVLNSRVLGQYSATILFSAPVEDDDRWRWVVSVPEPDIVRWAVLLEVVNESRLEMREMRAFRTEYLAATKE